MIHYKKCLGFSNSVPVSSILLTPGVIAAELTYNVAELFRYCKAVFNVNGSEELHKVEKVKKKMHYKERTYIFRIS